MEWILREYMNKKHIRSFKELSGLTGIEYRTLLNHIEDVGKFKAYELAALDNVLQLSSDDLLRFIREAR